MATSPSHDVTESQLFGELLDSVFKENASALLVAWRGEFAELMARDGRARKLPAGGHDVLHNTKLQNAIIEISRGYFVLYPEIVKSLSAYNSYLHGNPGALPEAEVRAMVEATATKVAAFNSDSITVLKSIDYNIGDDKAVAEWAKYYDGRLDKVRFDSEAARPYVKEIMAIRMLGSIIRRSLNAFEEVYGARPNVTHALDAQGGSSSYYDRMLRELVDEMNQVCMRSVK